MFLHLRRLRLIRLFANPPFDQSILPAHQYLHYPLMSLTLSTSPPPPTPLPCHHTYELNYDQFLIPNDFIPVRYSGELLVSTIHITYIPLLKRKILKSFHPASPADFKEYAWILKHGASDHWYTKPSPSWLSNQDTLRASAQSPSDMPAVDPARPVSLETPRLWVTAALATPIDDDVYDCGKKHGRDVHGSDGACPVCTKEKSEVLNGASLVYCIVLSTYQASEPFVHGAHFNGKAIFRVVKCGTRERASAEAFNATVVNGWSVELSCVLREGEMLTENAKRVEKLWELGEEDEIVKEGARVFY